MSAACVVRSPSVTPADAGVGNFEDVVVGDLGAVIVSGQDTGSRYVRPAVSCDDVLGDEVVGYFHARLGRVMAISLDTSHCDGIGACLVDVHAADLDVLCTEPNTAGVSVGVVANSKPAHDCGHATVGECDILCGADLDRGRDLVPVGPRGYVAREVGFVLADVRARLLVDVA